MGVYGPEDSPLSVALGKLSCFPMVSFPVDCYACFSIAGEDAGDFINPNVNIILRKSKPSSFGKGGNTVMDPTYRKGKEIGAADFDPGLHYEGFVQELQKVVSATLFVGKTIELKLHKLVVYERGGHFDWHRDSTHSDKHHATVLVALNTEWTGGDLILRRNGVETHADMPPEVVEGFETIVLQAVAFYTDTEHKHKVEPISEGIRVVLQYDVEVTSEEYEEGKAGDPYADDFYYEKSPLARIEGRYSVRAKCQEAASLSADQQTIVEIIAMIQKLHDSKVNEVGCALQYLYRKQSIRPEFLKGCDALLYEALKTTFNVLLLPVVLEDQSNSDGDYDRCVAYRFNGGNTEDEAKSAQFHLPKISAIRQTNKKDYIEHIGNEPQIGEYQYFGGGMFVRLKSNN